MVRFRSPAIDCAAEATGRGTLQPLMGLNTGAVEGFDGCQNKGATAYISDPKETSFCG